jgi:hypothetical protein
LLQGFFINNIPDTYCVMRLGASKSVCKLVRSDDLAPEWEDESGNFVMYDMDQKVSVNVYGKDVANSKELLGGAEVKCRELFSNANEDGADGTHILELELDGKRTGCQVMIRADFFHLTDKLHSFASSKYDGKPQKPNYC